MIDVFRVGVHLGFTSNGAQVMGLLTRELGLLHGSVDRLAEKWTKMKPLIGGAVAAFAGAKALEGMWKMVEASKELNKELNRTRQLGGEFASTLGEARLTAFRTAGSVPTTTPSDNVKVQRELAAQMQNPQAAVDVLPLAQRTAYVISNFTGEKTDDIVKNLVKVAELRAQLFTEKDGKEIVDPAKVKTEFDAAMRALLLTGGFLKSNDLVQMAKQAGVPAKGMTPEAFYADAAEMSVSQGASRTGTALTSMYQQLVGGTMQRRVAEEMQRMGLLHQGEWTAKRGGAIVVQPQARERLASQVGPDPIAYITGPLNEMMNKRGMSAQQKLDEVFQLFGRQTTQRLVAEALSSGPLFERARHMFGVIPDADQQYKTLQAGDLDTNIKSFQAAWTGLMQALGEQGIPLAITIMHKLTDALHAMTAWSVEHPEAVHNLEMFAAGLASVAALGGTLIVTATALRMLGGALSLLLQLTGIPALATGISALATATALFGIGTPAGLALTALAAGIGAIAWALKGIDSPEAKDKMLDSLRNRTLKPGSPGAWVPPPGALPQGDQSPLFHKEGFLMQPPQRSPIQLTSVIQLDGREVARTVSVHMGREGNRAPLSGATGADRTISPFAGAMAI